MKKNLFILVTLLIAYSASAMETAVATYQANGDSRPFLAALSQTQITELTRSTGLSEAVRRADGATIKTALTLFEARLAVEVARGIDTALQLMAGETKDNFPAWWVGSQEKTTDATKYTLCATLPQTFDPQPVITWTGFKVRGSYPNWESWAQMRANQLEAEAAVSCCATLNCLSCFAIFS